MSWKVESYDAYDHPRHWINQGEYDDAVFALARAHLIIRRSLESLYRNNPKVDGEGLMNCYRGMGEVPSIFGEPRVRFNAFEAAKSHVEKITGSQPLPDPEWVLRLRRELNLPAE
jgi:hypothetical protein